MHEMGFALQTPISRAKRICADVRLTGNPNVHWPNRPSMYCLVSWRWNWLGHWNWLSPITGPERLACSGHVWQ